MNNHLSEVTLIFANFSLSIINSTNPLSFWIRLKRFQTSVSLSN